MQIGIKRRKRIGKILVLLLASGSLLGISPLTAMADTWTVVVVVEDSTPPACVPDITPADWSPDPIVSYPGGNTVDLAEPDIVTSFAVTLGLSEGSDMMCSTDVPLTGTIVASFSSAQGLSLVDDSLTCPASLDPLCTADFMSGGPGGGTISGQIAMPITETEGNLSGELTVTWTPS